jgi:transcriptional regulator GlxA family with amidase domain
MTRKDLIALGAVAAATAGSGMPVPSDAAVDSPRLPANSGKPLVPPKTGCIEVAVMVCDQATLIDFAGPMEMISSVWIQDRGTSMDDQMPFHTYVVSNSTAVISTAPGMRVVPDYSFDDAPQPNVIVVGAQSALPEADRWLQHASKKADVTMSVCTGAFILARAGLLDGLYATTHHDSYDRFEKMFPKVKLVRGPRYVENYEISTAGGLTSGMDLALRVVERYFGTPVKARLAAYEEFHSTPRTV